MSFHSIHFHSISILLHFHCIYIAFHYISTTFPLHFHCSSIAVPLHSHLQYLDEVAAALHVMVLLVLRHRARAVTREAALPAELAPPAE